LLVRDRETGETQPISKGGFGGDDGVVFTVDEIFSDTRFLYRRYYWNYGPDCYYIYDSQLGGNICVSSDDYGELCDLGNERYLWCETNIGLGSGLYLIDMGALAAGSKDAKRTLFNWGSEYSGDILHLSSDRRFVYVELYRYSDDTRNRGVYDTETGEQLAFFELPFSNDHTITGHFQGTD